MEVILQDSSHTAKDFLIVQLKDPKIKKKLRSALSVKQENSQKTILKELNSKIKERDKNISADEEISWMQIIHRRICHIAENLITFLNKQHYSRRLDECGESNKKKWDILREMTGQGQKGSTCDKLIDNDSVVTDPKEITNNFNNYFTEIAEKLITKRNVASTTNAPELSLLLHEKTNTKEMKIIKNLRGNASPGHDGSGQH
ncbi:hypothetical protein HHI36_005614 [Cryptolaemus montrouzieri]|uniref:Uncharacterized protein n=1 Tax=Cryptolaemus montrouzieri TaxID=559131 RepID=A0ABD2NUK8_9CUCU